MAIGRMRVWILCLLAVGLTAAGAPMRWRVFSDPQAGVAFRFPYYYHIVDQYRGVVQRPGPRQVSVTHEADADPAEVRAMIKKMKEQAHLEGDLEMRWFRLDELPAGVVADDLATAIRHVALSELKDFSTYDYYSDIERRPHADPDWALPDIRAMRAAGPESCAMAVSWLDHIAVLSLRGSASDDANKKILDSFEVLAPTNVRQWLAQRERRDRRDRRLVEPKELMTWRTARCLRDNVVFGPDGEAASGRAGPTDAWADAWEIETFSYHITSTVSAKQLHYFGGTMETLHDAFVEVYRPDRMPPYKMEIHIAQDVDGFAALARDMGIGQVATGRGGSLTGGFFVPRWLAICTFAEPVRGFDTRVEGVLAHEASHQFLHVACNGSAHVPTWINEGLAVYFEAGDYRPGRAPVWKPPKGRLDMLRRMYQRLPEGSTLTPLGTYLGHYGHIPAQNYAEVYLMTHFLVWGSRSGRDLFRQYWQALRDGEDGTKAFERLVLDPLIEARGSREAGLRAWAEMLQRWLGGGYAYQARTP